MDTKNFSGVAWRNTAAKMDKRTPTLPRKDMRFKSIMTECGAKKEDILQSNCSCFEESRFSADNCMFTKFDEYCDCIK